VARVPYEENTMAKTLAIPPSPALDWVLIANAARARCFVRDADNGAMREERSFVHPASGKVRKSMASTQFAPHTDAHDKEHAAFAREITAFLEEAALAQRYPALSLIASAAFLGELRAHLGPAAHKRLRQGVPLDLSAYEGAELEHRVTQALASTATG
jgi:protein required for attachment to host cells